MKINRSRFLSSYFEILAHVILWGIIVTIFYNSLTQEWLRQYKKVAPPGTWGALSFFEWKKNYADYSFLIYITSLTLFKSIFFYINVYFIFPGFKYKPKRLKYILVLVFNIFLCLWAETILVGLTEDPDFDKNYGTYSFDFDFDYYILQEALLPYFIILCLSVIYWASRQWFLNRNGLSQLKKTTAELTLLRNQVNPHFLFNTLNNFYAMAMEKNNAELAQSIAQLTQLMRYNIYESRVDYIDLKREIEYIEDYIRLQKLRFAAYDDIDIRFDTAKADPGFQLTPMLLISFVENAFKHGISLKKPAFIHISITTEKNDLTFLIRNSIHRQNQKSTVKYAGFGLNHVKELLQWQYPKKHQLEVTEESNVFSVMLKLKQIAD